jgi:hypothetical protein
MSLGTSLVSMGLVLLLGAPVAAKELVELPGGRVYEVRVASDVETLWVALIPAQGGTLEGLGIDQTPVDVGLGSRHESALLKAFNAKLVPASKEQSPGIELVSQLAQLPQPGTYDVSLTLRQGTESQLLKLQVIVPEAQLRVRAPLLVERVIGLDGEAEATQTPLTLSETGGRSRATQLSIQPISAAVSGDHAVTGHLAFTAEGGQPVGTVVLPPGGTASLTYAPLGEFPLGTTKGTVEVTAPQLKTPLAVTYEVRTRRTAAWLFLLLVGGLLAGYLTRTWLKYRIDLGEKRVALESLHQRIVEEQSRSPDEKLQEALKGALALLSQARDRDLKELSDAVTEAEKRLMQALEDLARRRAEAQLSLGEQAHLLDVRWSVPASIQAQLEKARGELAASQKALAAGDVVAANRLREALFTGLAAETGKELLRWRDRVDAVLARLREAPLPLRKEDRLVVTPRFEQIHNAVWQVPLDAAEPELRSMLEGTHAARVLLRNTAAQLQSHVRRVLQSVRDVLVDNDVPLEKVEQAITAWRQAPEPVEEALEWIGDQSASVERVLNAVTVERLGTVPDAEVRPLVDERRYVELAAIVVRRKRASGALSPPLPFGASGAVLPPATAAAAVQTPVVPAVAFTDAPGAALWGAGGLSRVVELFWGPAPVPARPYALAYGALLRAKAARTLIVGIAIVGVGYLLFAEKFTGTAQDMAGVFVWGFTIDVSVDALADILSKNFKRT